MNTENEYTIHKKYYNTSRVYEVKQNNNYLKSRSEGVRERKRERAREKKTNIFISFILYSIYGTPINPLRIAIDFYMCEHFALRQLVKSAAHSCNLLDVNEPKGRADIALLYGECMAVSRTIYSIIHIINVFLYIVPHSTV